MPTIPITCGTFKPSRICCKGRFRIPRASESASVDVSSHKSPTAAVEAGLERFQANDAQAALLLFQRAQQLNPNDDEMCAALYNSACALTRLKRWQEAADAVVAAVNNHGLRLSVALKDADLESLRERREWIDALNKVEGGITDESLVRLRSEAKAPFRLVRIFLFGGLAAGAGLGLLVTLARLASAVKGGEGAPDTIATLQNLAINSAGLVGLSYLVSRDLEGRRRDEDIVGREEKLGKLQLSFSGGRVLPLASLRKVVRPVILAGSKGQVNKAIAAAEGLYPSLKARGICLIPVILSQDDPDAKLRQLKEELKGSSRSSGGFGTERSTAPNEDTHQQSKFASIDNAWLLPVYGLQEWSEWLTSQKPKLPGLFYIQVQLDGSVRASGSGIPPWEKFLDDVPELEDVRTKLTDGAGM